MKIEKPYNLSEVSKNKVSNFIYEDIKDIKNPQILEFGVRAGHSTKFFLDLCKKNNGKCISVDIKDYSNLFNDENWTFIHSKDDNFTFIKNQIPKQFDIIFLDTLHEAQHVEKIFYNYFDMLKKNGLFIIDDISWIPYLKNSWRDNFNLETENRKTFELLLDIFLTNQNNISLDFTFSASGLAKIKKISSKTLNKKKHTQSRIYSLRNFLKQIKRKIIKN